MRAPGDGMLRRFLVKRKPFFENRAALLKSALPILGGAIIGALAALLLKLASGRLSF